MRDEKVNEKYPYRHINAFLSRLINFAIGLSWEAITCLRKSYLSKVWKTYIFTEASYLTGLRACCQLITLDLSI